MPDLVDINCYAPDVLYISKSDTYGGKKFDINVMPDVIEMVRWYREYREQMIKESKAREQFESVASAYEQYQTTLKLVLDQI